MTTHPLEPLGVDELRASVAAVRAAVGDEQVRFVSASLLEPAKADYVGWRDGDAPPPGRTARVVLVDQDRRVRELVTDLSTRLVTDDAVVEGAKPPITPDEYAATEAAVRNDAQFQDMLRRRGLHDLSTVQIDVLAAGVFGHELESAHRIARCVAYARPDGTENGYARPIESVITFVDLDEQRVLAIEEYDHKPLPQVDGSYRAGTVPARTDLKPIEISQPAGISFSVQGNEVRWHRWSLRVSIDAQEGLVLHDVRYDDRRVLHRASCAEMIVPYGERHPMHAWRTYFDAGEYGLGAFVNSLEYGCDCIGEIRYLDAHLINGSGEPYTVTNAICLHEEDAGLLWKHSDERSGSIEVRRGRRFVVNAMVTVGNYDYGFRWNLNLDGSIDVEVQLHGIVSTMALGPGEAATTSNQVAPGLAAPHHQHLFCFRLDLDVDGTDNTVFEEEAEPLPPGPENPLGNAFRARRTPISHARDACRDAREQRSRTWLVVNPRRTNTLGQQVGYRVVPGAGTATLLADPESSIARRAGFARHTLWVTRHDPAQRHPAGTYPYGALPTSGLPEWCNADRALTDTDVVVWYVAGTTHFVRPEEWPIMPVSRSGFRLEPVGFFDRNPTLDIPPPHGCAHHTP